jgi:signal transduction histidine kinase
LKKVLLVDDNDENLYYLNVLTKSHGLESVEAGNGVEALEVLKENKIDLIISDILMPVMDGFNLCRKCKEDDKLKKIPFLFYTATYTDDSDKKFALQLGADRFLIKPSEPEVLLKTISEVLEEYEKGEKINIPPVEQNEIIHDEKIYYKDYSQTLIRKLEKKMLDLERTNKELVIAKEKAEEINRLKTSFLSNMSHELRTPMVGILGISGFMLNDSEDPWVKKMGRIIHSSASRLMETLSTILDLSSLESESLKINMASFELINVVKDSVELFLKAAVEKDLFIKTEFQVPYLRIVSDERMFRKALNNILNNAVKFTEAGGITVAVKMEEEGSVKNVIIKIIDTGIGISQKDQQNIWDEFRQVSEGWGRHYEGTGLGLTITKKIINKISGDVSLESETGKGTTITFKIPLINNELSAYFEQLETPSENYAVPAIPDMKKSLLLVDDDFVNLTVISDFLKNHYAVDCVSNGADAIKKANEKKYSVILMDINLGKGMTGIEAIEEIKKNPYYAAVPIVAMTAYAMEGDKEKLLEQGCTHYIPKPFEKKDLLKFMEGVK